VALDHDNARVTTFGLWGSAEHLLWWIKNDRVPPLVTAGGNGVLGAPGTRVLLDDLNFAHDFRQGGRFTLGYDFESRR
jgi:Putative beta barrel porin-7 (BBP7)